MQHRDLSTTPLRVNDQALEVGRSYGLDELAIRRIARFPQTVCLDPSTPARLADNGWVFERRRRGDVTVVVAYPDDGPVTIWYVNMELDINGLTPPRNTGGTTGSDLPKTPNELRRRVAQHPDLHIEPGGRAGDRIVDKEGRYLGSLHRTPSDRHSIPLLARAIAKRGYDLTRSGTVAR